MIQTNESKTSAADITKTVAQPYNPSNSLEAMESGHDFIGLCKKMIRTIDNIGEERVPLSTLLILDYKWKIVYTKVRNKIPQMRHSF